MGETPAKMGFFPIMIKVKGQADLQVPQETQQAEQAVA